MEKYPESHIIRNSMIVNSNRGHIRHYYNVSDKRYYLTERARKEIYGKNTKFTIESSEKTKKPFVYRFLEIFSNPSEV